jgi:hypothetical protein
MAMKTKDKWILGLTCGVVALLLVGALIYAGVENIRTSNARMDREEAEAVEIRRQAHEKARVQRLAEKAKFEAWSQTPEGLAQAARREVKAKEEAAARAAEQAARNQAIKEAKGFIERTVRNPSTVEYHHCANSTTGQRHIIILDFTATNGDGRPSRQGWSFSFDKRSNKLLMVLAEATIIYNAEPLE